ncbi:MAG: DUF917 family protein [Actinomycetota bacterium]
MTSGIEVPPSGTIGQDELEAITLGASVFASGGVALEAGSQLADELAARLGTGAVGVVALDQIPDGAAVAAPTTHPRIRARPSIDSAATAFRELGRCTVGELDAVLPTSLDPRDLLVAIGVALECDVPLVDAAGSARSVPRLTMTSWAAAGITPGLLAFADGIETTTIGTDSLVSADHAAEALLAGGSMTGSIGSAAWAMSGPAGRRASIPAAVSSAWQLGSEILAARADGRDPVERALAVADGAIVIGRGSLRRTVVALGDDDRLEAEIDTPLGPIDVIALDANLRVVRRDATVVAAPDLITVLGPDGAPRTLRELTSDDAIGTLLTVIAMPAPAAFEAPIVLDAFGELQRRSGGSGERVPFPESSA